MLGASAPYRWTLRIGVCIVAALIPSVLRFSPFFILTTYLLWVIVCGVIGGIVCKSAFPPRLVPDTDGDEVTRLRL